MFTREHTRGLSSIAWERGERKEALDVPGVVVSASQPLEGANQRQKGTEGVDVLDLISSVRDLHEQKGLL